MTYFTTPKVTVNFVVGLTKFMTPKGYRVIRGCRDLLYNPKGHRVIRGRRDLLYDPKGHVGLCGRFDLVYDPKRAQGH